MENIAIIALVISIIWPFINLWLNERIKAKVNIQVQKEVSKFQKEIDLIKNKENFKFTKLHEKRLEVLETTYSLLNTYYLSLSKYLDPLKVYDPNEIKDPNKKDYEAYVDSYHRLFEYFSQKKIYYEIDLEKQIEEFLKNSYEISLSYTKYIFYREHNVSGEEMSNTMKKAMTSYQEIPIQILPLKEKLEERFREILEK